MINKVILIGNLGADPELRYTQDQNCVCNLRLATTERWRDGKTGETKEHTEWHRVDLWGKIGEAAGKYLRKGSRVYIEGSLRSETWQDKHGQKRTTTKIRGLTEGTTEPLKHPAQQYHQPQATKGTPYDGNSGGGMPW